MKQMKKMKCRIIGFGFDYTPKTQTGDKNLSWWNQHKHEGYKQTLQLEIMSEILNKKSTDSRLTD